MYVANSNPLHPPQKNLQTNFPFNKRIVVQKIEPPYK